MKAHKTFIDKKFYILNIFPLTFYKNVYNCCIIEVDPIQLIITIKTILRCYFTCNLDSMLVTKSPCWPSKETLGDCRTYLAEQL